MSSGLQKRGTSQLVISSQFKACISDGMVGCKSACRTGNLHIWNGTIKADIIVQILQQRLPSRLLFHRRTCIFQQDSAKLHTTSITTEQLHIRRFWVLDWPACSHFTNWKNSVQHETKYEKDPQIPNIYRLLLKDEGMLHTGKHGPLQTISFFQEVVKYTT